MGIIIIPISIFISNSSNQTHVRRKPLRLGQVLNAIDGRKNVECICYCSMDRNFFLWDEVVLTARVLALKVKSSTSSSCSVDSSMNSPDQFFSFSFSDTVACKGIREDTNLSLPFLEAGSLHGDDVDSDSCSL